MARGAVSPVLKQRPFYNFSARLKPARSTEEVNVSLVWPALICIRVWIICWNDHRHRMPQLAAMAVNAHSNWLLRPAPHTYSKNWVVYVRHISIQFVVMAGTAHSNCLGHGRHQTGGGEGRGGGRSRPACRFRDPGCLRAGQWHMRSCVDCYVPAPAGQWHALLVV